VTHYSKCLPLKNSWGAWEYSLVVSCLPSMCEALDSVPCTIKISAVDRSCWGIGHGAWARIEESSWGYGSARGLGLSLSTAGRRQRREGGRERRKEGQTWATR
jgi:hypothetical protein